MHTFSETGNGVPAFLAKLWRLVEDPETNHLIYWNRDGRSFIIQNQAQFARELLPMNYKHNNMASFIRQLNMYGFHKITSIENGGLKFDRDEMEFSHPCFKRGYPYLLEHIKRKIATTKTIDEKANIKPEAVSKVLNEVKAMRGRQDSLDSRFSAMKQENEALWREIAMLRQKHMKQQQIVNKLIQFLVTIVQPSRNMTGVKRNFQLMINDVPQSSKIRKRTNSNSGPVIHELTEELLDEVADDEEDEMDESPHVMSPGAETRTDACDIGEDISRPRSTLTTGSFSETNAGDECLRSPNMASTSQTIGPDNVIYHITELSENADDNLTSTSAAAQRNNGRPSAKRARKRKHVETETTTSNSMVIPSTSNQRNEDLIAGRNIFNIKKEKDLDPLSFLSDPNQVDEVVVDSQLMDALTGDNSALAASRSERGNDKHIYINQDDFISDEMPTDLFDESTVASDLNVDGGNFNQNLDFGAGSSSSTVETESNSNKIPTLSRSLSVTKYSNDEILRLNNARDITTHLDTVQGDIDTLKDLLRGDGYTIDANTVLNYEMNLKNAAAGDRLTLHPSIDSDTIAKLFSDSDIFGPYGLHDNSDNSKKGNELMTYQPSYYPGDLSDILNLDSDSLQKEYDAKQDGNNSELNTPMPDRD